MRGSLGPWIALAGLLVGAGLAVGLYFGLRRAPAPAAPIADRKPPMDAPAPPPDLVRIVRSALEPLRLEWRAACWKAPPASSHMIELAFDASGQEIARSILDERGRSRDDVTVCLREQPYKALRIAPPGTPVTLRLPLAFP